MGKAIVDPAELRRFARDLHRFNAELQALVQTMNSRLSDLEKTWRDQEQKKFADEFRQTSKMLGRFIEASNNHTNFLLRKAGHIEDYLSQR